MLVTVFIMRTSGTSGVFYTRTNQTGNKDAGNPTITNAVRAHKAPLPTAAARDHGAFTVIQPPSMCSSPSITAAYRR